MPVPVLKLSLNVSAPECLPTAFDYTETKHPNISLVRCLPTPLQILQKLRNSRVLLCVHVHVISRSHDQSRFIMLYCPISVSPKHLAL